MEIVVNKTFDYEVMISNKKSIIANFIIIVLFVASVYWLASGRLWKIIIALQYIQGSGTFSVVRDIRGLEPYMTIKMNCYYSDDAIFGHTWKGLLNNTRCHQQLFRKCFSERTIAGRHQTHVITFHSSKHINRCLCTNFIGWYTHVCDNSTKIQCCLDRGAKSVQCRV